MTMNNQANDKACRRDDFIDDVISRCGSISGETFVSLRSRRDCSSIRQHKTDVLARNLREYHAATNGILPGDALGKPAQQQQQQQQVDAPSESRRFFNSSFHHYRFIVAMMGGTSVGVMMLLRYNISIAILRMVNQTHLYLEEHPDRTVEDFLEAGYALGGEFNWNNEIVAIILSWYMFSYTLPQTLMAKLASMLGCRTAIPLSMITCGLATIVTPKLSYYGWQYVVACRMLNGLGASAILPLMLRLIEKWMRYDEITVGLTVAQVLNSTISAITPLFAGYLTGIHWSYAFYVPGSLAIVFSILWLIMISDEPESNWLISEKELNFICDCEAIETNSMQEVDLCDDEERKQPTKSDASNNSKYYYSYKPDSWTQILGVPSFYAYILIWTLYCTSTAGFLFVMPAYLRQFLKIHVTENGIYCFIIQLGSIVGVIWPHQLLKLFQRLGLSQTRSRIACYALCCSIAAGTWIYVGTYHNLQLLMLSLNRAVHPASDVIITGCLMSNYAKAGFSSLAFSMINTLGNFSIVGVSTFFGWLLDYTGASRQGWCYIFSSIGGAQIIMFLIFATCVSFGPVKFRNKRKPMMIEEQHTTTCPNKTSNDCNNCNKQSDGTTKPERYGSIQKTKG